MPSAENRRSKSKQSLYLKDDTLAFLQAEAQRQDRSMSYLVQKALEIARPQLERFPGRLEGVSG